jgi:hypothetical protein
MSKEKLPCAVKQQILWMVRDYDRMRREYKRMRRDILDAGGEHYTTYVVNGEERRAYISGGHNASRSTEDRQMQLETLEQTPMVKQMRAIEHASARIGKDLPELLRDQLRESILINCQSGRKYPFERLLVTGISRSDFYRVRDSFFVEIAAELGLL